MQLSGTILDIYDDPSVSVLIGVLGTKTLPEKLASAHLLDAEHLQALPDRLFGLVAQNGESTLRKYAMHDEAHLVTSVMYFLKCKDSLPEEAQKFAAARLLEGCEWYDVLPPDELKKVAFLGTVLNAASAMGGIADMKNKAVAGMAKHRSVMAGLGKVAQGGVESAVLDLHQDFKKTHGLTTGQDHSAQAGGPLDALGRLLEDLGAKTADLNGTSDFLPATSKPTGGGKQYRNATKTASIDLTFSEPAPRVQAQEHTHFAIQHEQRYPLTTTEHVKAATRYFDEHVTAFTPFERRAFAQSVWGRSEELGTKTAGAILEYAGESYGPHIEAELLARVRGFDGTGKSALYEELLEKRAHIQPSVMAHMLTEADEMTGADASYGRVGVGYRDPFAAVYGSAKTAAQEKWESDRDFSWKDGTDYVCGSTLKTFAGGGAKQLDGLFPTAFAMDFVKDPVGVFKSMPDPQKQIISRLANTADTVS